jgi:CheY-like chemotaxis protein
MHQFGNSAEASPLPFALRLTRDIVLNTPLPMLLACGNGHTIVNAAYSVLFGPDSAHQALPPGLDPAAFARARAGASLRLEQHMLGNGAARHACDVHLTALRDQNDQVCGVLCAVIPGSARGPGSSAAVPGLRILVVEDNLDSQYLVCEMLRAFGHDSAGADDAEAALEMLAAAPYQVLFSDLSLPGMSGIELARQALRMQPALHVIFASGYGASMLQQLEFPFQSLQKPYEVEQLQAALNSITEKIRPSA